MLEPASKKTILNKAKGLIDLNYHLHNSARQYCTFYQQEPLRVLSPKMEEVGIPTAILINTSGGVVGGDQHTINIHLANNTKALVTTQAAEKIYYSAGSPSLINTHLQGGDQCWFEWLPQETILFNNAYLKRSISFNLSSNASGMAGEIVLFGRSGRGETFQTGSFQDSWKIHINNDLLWYDALHLQEGSTLNALNHMAGFNQATAYATLVYIDKQAHTQLETARTILKTFETKNYATSIDNSILLIRWLSTTPIKLRKEFSYFWGHWRNLVSQLPNALPRIWHF